MKVRCVFCKQISDKKDWKEENEDCELCGSHTIQTCPECGDSDECAYEEME